MPDLGTTLAIAAVMAATQMPTDRAAAEVCTPTDPALDEISGLVIDGDTLVTTNDSGDGPVLYVLDAATCETRRTVSWSGTATDVEALAPLGPGHVLVADIGDNTRSRSSISVAAVRLSDGATTTHELRYPDGPHDAEAVLVQPGTRRVLIVTKEVFGGTVYAARLPATASDRPVRLRPQGRALPLVTDGAFLDGGHLVLRNYGRAVVYAYPDLTAVGEVPLPAQRQGEALAVDGKALLVASEGVGMPVLRVRVPTAIVDAMSVPTPGPEPTPTASPTTGVEAPADPASSAQAPEGREPWPWVLAVPGVVAVGAAIMALLRRRRRPTA